MLFNSSSLWEGEDHLLLVRSHVVIETYQRFLYRDIQAIVVCRTKTGLITSVTLAALAAACGAPILFVSGEAAVGFAVFAGLLLVAAITSFLLGPTCKCLLRTAVQTQELPSLSRLRAARKALALIRPKIASFQEERPAK